MPPPGARSQDALDSERDRADAYSSLGVLCALVFGFAASLLYTVEPSQFRYGDTAPINQEALRGSLYSLSLSVALSGYGLMVFAMQYYHLKRLIAEGRHVQIKAFRNYVKKPRNFAKWSLPASMVCLLIGIIFKVNGSLQDPWANLDANRLTRDVAMILGLAMSLTLAQEVFVAYRSIRFRHEPRVEKGEAQVPEVPKV